MKLLVQAAALTAVVVVPLLVALLLPVWLALFLIVVYLAVVASLIHSALASRSRLSVMRDAELDALFDGVFSDYEADLSRFPFRVHVFRRGGVFPVEKLRMVYHYRTHSTDPDRELCFYRYFGGQGQGLVWQSCEHGDVRYFRRDDVADTKSEFRLRGTQDTATRDVLAVLALPVRQLVALDGTPHKQRQIGVLTFDALTPEAADALGMMFVQFRAGEQPALAELADRVSFYVG
jgi:hypothetical protein